MLKIARLFNVSTDFLLGETNIPDRKNYDIAELGLSVEAAKNLYTGRVNTEVVNLLLENARFAELTYRISQYFDDINIFRRKFFLIAIIYFLCKKFPLEIKYLSR